MTNTISTINSAKPSALKSLESELFAFLNRKYVQSQDERQRSMDLQYMTAETHDLAREIAKYMFNRDVSL